MRQTTPQTITENQWLNQVIDIAHLYGWRAAHFRPAMTAHGWRTPVSADGAGFPDCVFVHAEQKRVVFAELKRDGGKLSPKQEEWRDALLAAGAEWFCWTPNQWDEVVTVLQRKPGT